MAIDGPDAAGKTTLADKLVEPIRKCGRAVIRASIDGFHNPAAVRYARGAENPEGYFRDSFDHEILIRSLLAPLGPGGSLKYKTVVFDFRSNAPIVEPAKTAPSNAVLLFDGVFLLRPELIQFWDFSIFVETGFETILARAIKRDAALFGDAELARTRHEKRYIAGQKLYFEECGPRLRADLIVDNNDPSRPAVREKKEIDRF